MSTETSQPRPSELDEAELMAFITRAQNGDETTLPAIPGILSHLSDQSRREIGGDLGYQAERAIIDAYAQKNLWVKGALKLKMEQLRSELAGANPSPLEQLLVERVVLCWAFVNFSDIQYASAGTISYEHGDYLQRKQERSLRRYLAAIKCLATVRRLALPIKVAVTVAGTVESQSRPSCRRPVDEGHSEGLPSGARVIAPKTVNRVGRSHVRE